MVSLLQEIDTEHEDMVHHAALDFYGLLLATCSSDGSVRIFHSRKNNKALAELKGHQGPVWQVAWAHPKFGNILASCSYDRKVIVWKSTTPRDWTKLYEYSNHDSSVNSVDFAPSEYGLVLACASSDGSVSVLTCNTEYGVWDAKKIPNAHIGLPRSQIATASQDRHVIVWSSNADLSQWTSTVLHTFEDAVWSISWSTTGNILAVTGGDNNVTLWKENTEGQWIRINYESGTAIQPKQPSHLPHSHSQQQQAPQQHQQQAPSHPGPSSDSEHSSNLSNSQLSN
ncbi:protein SEC13 homolog [Drosophila teissieri]|uniref:protein SEC13 homolog n=1 Tax=Drosophila teissieri TaxID=7243 RepID=UPI001CBA3B53|nr:protein SEC13 homolog [Drosophila teissieri]